VVELIRLAEARVTNRTGRALQQGKAIFADGFVDLSAARGKLGGREVGGEEREAFLCEGCTRHEQGNKQETQSCFEHKELLLTGQNLFAKLDHDQIEPIEQII